DAFLQPMVARDQGSRLLRLQKVIACRSHWLHGRKAPVGISGVMKKQEPFLVFTILADDQVQVRMSPLA
ncbi:MAG TPA: hypothetical protein DEF45_14915, partial [Rhodopirellula sp.]|nr:hypothetical protein [Rhodopirellula sp.]